MAKLKASRLAVVGRVGGGADPRRRRLHARVAGGPLLLRRQGARDRRGHQRDPAPRDRPRPGLLDRALPCFVACAPRWRSSRPPVHGALVPPQLRLAGSAAPLVAAAHRSSLPRGASPRARCPWHALAVRARLLPRHVSPRAPARTPRCGSAALRVHHGGSGCTVVRHHGHICASIRAGCGRPASHRRLRTSLGLRTARPAAARGQIAADRDPGGAPPRCRRGRGARPARARARRAAGVAAAPMRSIGASRSQKPSSATRGGDLGADAERHDGLVGDEQPARPGRPTSRIGRHVERGDGAQVDHLDRDALGGERPRPRRAPRGPSARPTRR